MIGLSGLSARTYTRHTDGMSIVGTFLKDRKTGYAEYAKKKE